MDVSTHGDKVYLDLAKRWTKGSAILFAVGALSGTVLSFELGLLWREFMKYAGAIIGMPFYLESFAFFLEAIFLGVYLYGREGSRHESICSLVRSSRSAVSSRESLWRPRVVSVAGAYSGCSKRKRRRHRVSELGRGDYGRPNQAPIRSRLWPSLYCRAYAGPDYSQLIVEPTNPSLTSRRLTTSARVIRTVQSGVTRNR